MGNWCPTKSNYMGGWYFTAWKGKKEHYLPKKERSLIKFSRKHRAWKTPVETAIFVYTQSSKLGRFRRILVKTGTQINFQIVASVAVITSLGKHVFSEEFTQETAL